MKMTLVTATAMAAVLAITGPSLADKASREAAKVERQEKKAERQERKAERKAENGEHKGMGKWDKNHDGKMSFNERVAKYNSVPGWAYRKDLPGLGIDVSKVAFSKVSPTVTSILSGGETGQSSGQHNGATSDR